MSDLIRIEHPKIYLDEYGKTTHALVIDKGRIVDSGDHAMLWPVEEVVTPQGVCVMPALADAHIHMWGLGLRANSVSLRGLESCKEVYETLAKAETKGLWCFGHDWDQHKWKDANGFSLEKLDALFPERPLVLRRIDGHAIWVNTVALRLARCKSHNGLLVDEAMNAVLAAAPSTTFDEDKASFFRTADLLLDQGVSSAHIAWVEANRVRLLKELRAEKKLPLRIHTMLAGSDPEHVKCRDIIPSLDRECWLNFICIKFFADGALGSKGAQLLEPYSNGSFGEVIDTDEILSERLVGCAAKGWQPAVHAIGDKAVRRVMDQFDKIPRALRHTIRPRIEHVQMISDQDVKRHGVFISSIQPIHQYSDCEWADDVLNETQMGHLFRWRELTDRGPICAGSDYPIEDINPWHGMSVAVSRAVNNRDPFSAAPLTNHEAIAAYTTGPAYAAFWEEDVGRLREKYLADFIVPSVDPYVASADEIWDCEAEEVWINGKQVR